MNEILRLAAGISPEIALVSASASLSLLTIVATIAAGRRHAAAASRLEERIAQLAHGVSLLTNTTEDGLRAVAMEITRLAGAHDAKARTPQTSVRERVAAAAGHGRSVQDIAASEQLSEGEVLLHLLMDKLRPEVSSAEMC